MESADRRWAYSLFERTSPSIFLRRLSLRVSILRRILGRPARSAR